MLRAHRRILGIACRSLVLAGAATATDEVSKGTFTETLKVERIEARDALVALRSLAGNREVEILDAHTLSVRDTAEKIQLAQSIVALIDRQDSAEAASAVRDQNDGTTLASIVLRRATLAEAMVVLRSEVAIRRFATFEDISTVLVRDSPEQVAKAMHERAMSDELSLRGEAEGNADIKVGGTVEVKGVGTKLSGRYFVTSVEHVYSGRDYRTRFTSAGTAPSTLVDLLAGGAPVPWHRMGPVVGLVSDLGTGENEGLVKVKLPLLGDNIATNWARVMSVGAGATRGSLVMPSINDEVMVMFEDGDLRRPVVLGSLWNGIDKPPSPVVENGKVIEWVTKSQLGHTLTFRDGSADDKKNVEIALADKTIKLFLGTDKVELFAKDGKPLQLKSGDATITFTAQGDIEIKGGNIKLTATKDVEITGTNVKITGNSTAVVKGNSSVELSGAMAKINASGVTEVKGSIVKIN